MPTFVIDLFYDIVSPYSFIAFTQLHAYQALWGFTLRLQPVFQGAVMKGSGNSRQRNSNTTSDQASHLFDLSNSSPLPPHPLGCL